MTGSLRFRLTAFFLVGVVVTGLIAALFALRLFQDYARAQSLDELRREATGLAQLYGELARLAADQGSTAPEFAAATLEQATGDRIFYVGANVFPGQGSGLSFLPATVLPTEARSGRGGVSFEFTPPSERKRLLAVAEPVRLDAESQSFGSIIVAKPVDSLRGRWVPLVQRLALAFLGAIVFAAALAWYLSRTITGPVRSVSDAADLIASGQYSVRVPVGKGGDEISHLAERFNEMAARLSESEERERLFLMSVSHELRTPLTAIRGHVDALRDGLIEDPDLIATSLAVVADEAVRLERLVGDVLDLAKLNAHRFTVLDEEVEMELLAQRAYAAFAEEARHRDITFALQGAEEAPTITTDGDRVLQIISNLLRNAFRWTPDDGVVTLSLGTAGSELFVEVADSGPGIAPADQGRIFRPFHSTDTQGTGLGLPIARELAGALGGRIELRSSPGEGSRFRLVLPVDKGGDHDRAVGPGSPARPRVRL